MSFLPKMVYYCGKFFFAMILFVAMIISTIISLPFIGVGLIKDAMTLHLEPTDQNTSFEHYS
ncbi:hypothetical protein [Dyadobacter luticola]|uniref:Uncharacterized protein n=1 Tax=Dyadobacter luticola TaxID=1979387 RepID=A0A5R9KTC8_9BACT|nr:hypothetical protein [Dyadobacter luticola]TLU99364.1 hypothetical protein FEN17_22640 [Dyadobacter luticola]